MKVFVYMAMVIGSGLAAGCLEGPHGPVIGEVSGAFERADGPVLDEREGEDPCEGQTWPDLSDACIDEIVAKVCEAGGGTNCRDEDEEEGAEAIGGADELATISQEAGLFCTLCEVQGCKCYVWKQECYCPGLTSAQATENVRHVVGLSTGEEGMDGEEDDDILYDPEDDLLPGSRVVDPNGRW
ncbi:MAG TPA: hypothetical protein PK095_03795 [Myxococcota bacterium]|nr:hypothetical protein [Myxococcota bacterium]